MEIQYKIIKEKNLLIQKYYGVFSLEHYMASVEEMLKNPEWVFVEKILSDFRELELTNSFNLLDRLVSFRKDKIKENLQNVYIVNKPMATAAIQLYVKGINNTKYRFCSTLDYAISLLELSDSKEEIESIIENFSNKLE